MGPVPKVGCKGKFLLFQLVQLFIVNIFVCLRLPIKMPMFRVEGHTQDFPRISLQSVTAFH
jgi:hypothetical protein